MMVTGETLLRLQARRHSFLITLCRKPEPKPVPGVSGGVIGCGGQGRLDMSYFDPLVDIVALCDVDSAFGLATTLACGYGRKEGERNDTSRHLSRLSTSP